MISNDRISRKQRLKTLRNYKARIALILAVILLLLIVGKNYKTQLGILLGNIPVKGILNKSGSGGIDSLVFQTGYSFGLNNPPVSDTTAYDTSGSYHVRYTQLWPPGVPFEFYVKKMQELSGKSGIDCEFTQFGDCDSLICFCFAGDYQQAEVVIRPDKKAELEGRYLGIIIKNIYELENREIESIVKSRIPFGYLASIEVFPAGDIKKQLNSDWVSSILSVSVSRADLLKYDLITGKRDIDYRKSVSSFLDRYPKLALFQLERSDDADFIFVEAIVEEAREREIGYIYENRVPDGIDSLVFSTGLTFIDYGKLSDFYGKSLREIRIELIAELVCSRDPRKIAITIDVSNIPVQRMIEFFRYLRRIGINIIYIDKLIDHPEFTIEDL
jgi:hypothetical protein